MNLTENEIRNLPLEQQQKLVVELRGIKVSDRAYPNAKAIIDLITSAKRWKEPEKYKVKALENVLVDDRAVEKGQETEVYVWQYRALARFFELLDDKIKSGLEEAGEKVRKQREEGAKAVAAKAAAAMLALMALCFGFSAQAQGIYTTKQVLGATGFTNWMAASSVSNYNTGVITTNALTNVSWTISNGSAVGTLSTNYTYVTNVPGLMNLTHFDMAPIQMSYNLAGAGSSAVTAYIGASLDGLNWVTNFATLAVTANGTATVSAITNLSTAAFGSIGYLRLDAIQNANASAVTNLTFTYAVKPTRAGP